MVTLEAPTQVGRWSVRLRWSSDQEDPTFYIYRDGTLVATTKATERIFVLESGDAPVIEVFDSADDTPTTVYPSRFTLAWYAVAGADYYQVDEYVDSEWPACAKVTDDGAGYFKWTSRVLEDSETHQFRVIAVDAAGNESTATNLTALMVRVPDPSDVEYAYSETTDKVTVSAA